MKTQKFRKKPVVVEAYQTPVSIEIDTLEGTMVAQAGDWIITGVHGEQYPCKPGIFEETYEPVWSKRKRCHGLRSIGRKGNGKNACVHQL